MLGVLAAAGGVGAMRMWAHARRERRAAAAALALRLLALQRDLRQFLRGERYVRHSLTRERASQIEPLLADAAKLRKSFAPDALRALQELTPLAGGGFERRRRQANARYVERTAPAVRATVRQALGHDLTDEQAQAIATDEDALLVLAGAGSGKTSLMAGKAAWLIRQGLAQPDEILLLAFNRDAAQELRSRLSDNLSAHVFTFHAFTRRVMAEVASAAPSISKLSDDVAWQIFIDRALHDMLGNAASLPLPAFEFLTDLRHPHRSPFEFKTMHEYFDYVRNNKLLTLNGEVVKSFEELRIANFLARHGVAYEYERPYDYPTATAARQQYQPDFTIPAAGGGGESGRRWPIYVEHFALDANGSPPRDWGEAACEEYGQGVVWKRQLHQRHGTVLLETYSWQTRGGSLLPSLQQQLQAQGVMLEPVPYETLLAKLDRAIDVSGVTPLLRSFLRHKKTSMVSWTTLHARSRSFAEAARAAAFLALFQAIEIIYEQELRTSGQVDFEDLIRIACEHLTDGSWTSPYRYVLVDEFQDISAGRITLLAALLGPGAACTVVGDDWQSIYRFAGSDVRLVRGAGEHLGHTEQRELSQTFRFGRGVLDPATRFIRSNPMQTQRKMRPAPGADDHGVTIIAAELASDADRRDRATERQGLADALDAIAAAAAPDAQTSVLVLGRYRNSQNLLNPRAVSHSGLHVRFSTVHRAKGLEADYAVVLDLIDDRYGFPSGIEDDPLLDLAAPPLGDFAHEEERRLFYVALTRGRRGVFLITDPSRPSPFVVELARASSAQVRLLGEPVEGAACPCCKARLVTSQSARTLRCLSWPNCTYTAPACPECRAGYLLHTGASVQCTNAACAAGPAYKCPRCRYGALIRVHGRFGPFYGCNRYRDIPPCTYTQDTPPTQHPPTPPPDSIEPAAAGRAGVWCGDRGLRAPAVRAPRTATRACAARGAWPAPRFC